MTLATFPIYIGEKLCVIFNILMIHYVSLQIFSHVSDRQNVENGVYIIIKILKRYINEHQQIEHDA